MADFFQNGVITTLQKLRERPLDELEAELHRHGEQQRVCLVLPALYSEFEDEAMPHIVEELKGATYLHRIVLSLDRATEREFRRVREIMSALPTRVSILWNDGPTISGFLQELEDADFELCEQGKGRGVWLAMGYALADRTVHTIALHDCDIFNYRREMLSRLVYPIVHPAMDFEFSKGYYARVEEKLHGRVTRLFFTPLVRALRQIVGPVRFLDYLDSFRYPLSGEFAFIRSLAKSVRISPSWGLEVSLLGEVFELTTVKRVCQVEIADSYHHKHQQLSLQAPEEGLVRMATDIGLTLFGILAQGGVVLSEAVFQALTASYLRYARIAIEQYHSLAQLNGLSYDRHEEIEAVETFGRTLAMAEHTFREDPVGVPLMAAWVRIRAAIPDFTARLQAAVDRENGAS